MNVTLDNGRLCLLDVLWKRTRERDTQVHSLFVIFVRASLVSCFSSFALATEFKCFAMPNRSVEFLCYLVGNLGSCLSWRIWMTASTHAYMMTTPHPSPPWHKAGRDPLPCDACAFFLLGCLYSVKHTSTNQTAKTETMADHLMPKADSTWVLPRSS